MRIHLLLIGLLTGVSSVMAHAQAVPEQIEVLVFRVDYLSLQPEQYYRVTHPYHPMPQPFGCEAVARLYYCQLPALDFGYSEVFGGFSGLQIFKAATIWNSRGDGWGWEAPAIAQGSAPFQERDTPIIPTALVTSLRFYRVDPREDAPRDEATMVGRAEEAWEAIARLEPLHALAERGAVEVVVFDHFYSVGLGNPNTAEWVVVAYTVPGPVPER